VNPLSDGPASPARIDTPSLDAPDASGVAPALTWRDGALLRRGEAHRVLSGSLHYFRVHPAQWRDRLLRLLDLGLNTVDTYVPWNFHQQNEADALDFTGWRDLRGFIRAAQEVGLDVIVRPGPYICAEWSNGGLPAWVTARDLSLRSSDPRFLALTARWFDAVLPQIVDLQAAHGGPVVAVQVENEFGSYGDDSAYVAEIARMLRARGIVELLYTADGPTELMLDAGAVPGVMTAYTFGSKPEIARGFRDARRPGEPFLCAEFWNGWFDHWGQPHHIRDAANAAATVADIVSDGGSVSIYMAHGGTNFGLWAGANHVDGELRPTATSYDSDAPVAEDGSLTEKFFAIREALGATEPVRSPAPRFVEPFSVALRPGAGLLAALDAVAGPVVELGPTPTFEDLGLDAGLLRLEATVLLPHGETSLVLPEVADRATVYLDGVPAGVVTASGGVALAGQGRPARLTVIVENLGRVNYGPGLGERKGLRRPVLVDRRMIQRWSAAPIAVDRLGEAELVRLASLPDAAGSPSAAGLAVGEFELGEPADAHLSLPGSAKSFVWINDVLVGRHWEIGPQETLYVPAPLLHAGVNVVTVLEMDRRGGLAEFGDAARLGPTEEYIEEF